MNQRALSHARLFFTLVLVLGSVILAPSTVLGAGIYNKTDYTVIVAFTPDDCGGSPFVSNIFCANQVTLKPHQSWSSNNRAGWVEAGGSSIHYRCHASGKGFKEIFFEYMSCYVVGQGWVEIFAGQGTGRVEKFRMIAKDESGKETCTATAYVTKLEL